MATIKGNPGAQVLYLERQAAALKRKVGAGPADKTKRARKDHDNAQLAEKVASKRAETARRRATAMGITVPADKTKRQPADTK